MLHMFHLRESAEVVRVHEGKLRMGKRKKKKKKKSDMLGNETQCLYLTVRLNRFSFREESYHFCAVMSSGVVQSRSALL